MSIAKTGVWTSHIFQENYGEYFPLRLFNGYNGGNCSKTSDNLYTITSPVSSSTWGTGLNIQQNSLLIPYGYTYRISFEVNIPTTHNIRIDINNLCGNVSGNDHDASRTAIDFSISANIWTTIIWGSSNLNTTQNPDQLELNVYDGIGLVTTNDTASTVWTVRNPKIIIYKDELNIASIGKNGITHSNNFYEI